MLIVTIRSIWHNHCAGCPCCGRFLSHISDSCGATYRRN